METVREKLPKLLASKGLSLSEASKRIGKGRSYLHDYITRESPARLPEDLRLKLARLLGVQESELLDGGNVRVSTGRVMEIADLPDDPLEAATYVAEVLLARKGRVSDPKQRARVTRQIYEILNGDDDK